MPDYLIGYDLRKPGQDYTPLYAYLSGFNGKRIQGSIWLIEAKGPSDALAQAISNYLDQNDTLFVQPVAPLVGETFVSYNLPDAVAWLNRRVPARPTPLPAPRMGSRRF